MIANTPAVKANDENGAAFGRPRMSAIVLVPYVCTMLPAEKNRMGLVIEWAASCSRAAVIASGDPMPSPMAMRPIFSMLE
jgi:hypothetical protein